MMMTMMTMMMMLLIGGVNNKDDGNVHLGTEGVLGLELKELGHIVGKGEEDYGQNITKTIPNAALLKMEL